MASALQMKHQQQPGDMPAAAGNDAVEAALALLSEACDALELVLHPDVFGHSSESSRAKELIDNGGLLEHWARTFLLVLSRCSETDGSAATDKAAKLLWRLGPLLGPDRLHMSQGLPTTHPSLAYLLSAHLVRLAAVLDGGRVYGMPAAVLVPLPNTFGQNVPEATTDLVDTMLAKSALAFWHRHVVGLICSLGLWNGRCNSVRGAAPSTSLSSLRDAAPARLTAFRQDLAQLDAMTKAEYDMFFGDEKLYYDSRSNCADSIRELEALLQSPAVPPYHMAATHDVSMRLAAAARATLLAGDEAQTASAAWSALIAVSAANPNPHGLPPPSLHAAHRQQQAHPGLQQQQQQGQQGQRIGPRLTLDQAVSLGLEALLCARLALWDVGWAPELETPQAELEQLQGWWDCAADIVREAIRRTPEADKHTWRWRDLLPRLWLRVNTLVPETSVDAPFPPLAPSCDMAVALEHGYVRLLEMQLRKSRTSQDALFAQLFTDRNYTVDVWRRALALATPGEAAALLTTLGKVTRRVSADLASAGNTMSMAATTARTVNGLLGIDRLGFAVLSDPVTALARQELVRVQQNAGTLLAVATGLMSPRWLQGMLGYEPLLRSTTPVAAQDAAGGSNGGGGGGGGDGSVVIGDGDGDGGGGGGDGADPNDAAEAALASSRLKIARSLSYMAVRLLPDVCRLALKLAEDLEEGALKTLGDFAESIVEWVAMLQRLAAAEGQMARSERDPESESARRHAEAEAAWDRQLWDELRPLHLLGFAAHIRDRFYSRSLLLTAIFPPEAWAGAVMELLRLAPARRIAALTEESVSAAAAAAAAPAPAAASSATDAAGEVGCELNLPRLLEMLGPGGLMEAPGLLSEVERACEAAGARVAASGRDPPDAAAGAVGAVALLPERELRFAAMVPSPVEARGVVPVCDNPGCVSMEGDSEAGVRLSGCGRCGGRVRYCCKACQTAHWKAGHKAECAGSSGAAAAAAAGGGGGAGRTG